MTTGSFRVTYEPSIFETLSKKKGRDFRWMVGWMDRFLSPPSEQVPGGAQVESPGGEPRWSPQVESTGGAHQ